MDLGADPPHVRARRPVVPHAPADRFSCLAIVELDRVHKRPTAVLGEDLCIAISAHSFQLPVSRTLSNSDRVSPVR